VSTPENGTPNRRAAEIWAGVCGRTVETVVGYEVEPELETPKVGEIVMLRAAITNREGCASETFTVEVDLPSGIEHVPGQAHACSTTNNASFVCLLQPETGTSGGNARSYGAATLGRNQTFFLTIPIRFTSPFEGAPLRVFTRGSNANVNAFVLADAPYQDPQARNGDDIVVLGSPLSFQNVLPVAFSRGDGSFGTTSYLVTDFAEWAKTPGVKRVSGDFDGDGFTEVALLGVPGWATIPIAWTRGNGRFTVTNQWVGFAFKCRAHRRRRRSRRSRRCSSARARASDRSSRRTRRQARSTRV
jgi:hypothetical protein